jgi:Bacterial Ig-like domain (group 1)
MRKFVSIIALFWLTLVLAGCNGDSGSCGQLGGGSGSSSTSTSKCTTTPTPTTGTPASVSVSSTAASIPADGSTTATITALVKDSSGNVVSGAAVTFSTTAGTLSATTGTTGTSGTATTTLSAKGVTASSITVTATAGSSVQGTVSVMVGTVTGTQNSISVITSLPQIPSDGSKTATITALVRDTNNNLVSGVPVTFSATSGGLVVTQATTDATGSAKATLGSASDPSDRTITVTATAQGKSATVPVSVTGTTLAVTGASKNGNTLSATSVTTDSTGAAQFQLTVVNAGADTITVSGLGLQSQAALSVSNQSFSFTAPTANATIDVNTPTPVTLSWTALNASNVAVGQNGTVALTSSRGTLSAAAATVTNGTISSGAVTISSTTAGPAIISATALNSSNAVVATSQLAVNFVATTPAAVSLQAGPSTVPVQGQSTITATVTDPTGNPVQGKTVDFTLTDSTGGSLSAPSATTNAEGQASVTYKASTGSSAPNGVIITGTVLATSVTGTTTLTVGGQTVSLSLGTGNLITPLSSTQYEWPYTVQAVDAAGNGVTNVQVTFSVKAIAYAPGAMSWNFVATPTTPVSKSWLDVGFYTAVSGNFLAKGFCAPTSVPEYDGLINPTPPPAGVTPVQTNIPGSVVSTDVGSATTGTGGTATVNLIYPKDHAYWVAVALTATATVSGTQSSTTASFVLLGVATDYSNSGTSPPGQFSPYGQATSCY